MFLMMMIMSPLVDASENGDDAYNVLQSDAYNVPHEDGDDHEPLVDASETYDDNDGNTHGLVPLLVDRNATNKKKKQLINRSKFVVFFFFNVSSHYMTIVPVTVMYDN